MSWKIVNAIYLCRALMYVLMNSVSLEDISELLHSTAPCCVSKTMAAFNDSVFTHQNHTCALVLRHLEK